MTDDATIEEKQGFLRETILDKGYDVNKFIQFLTDKKGDEGADVSNWSMSDLQTVVKEFIKLQGGGVQEEPKPKVKSPEPSNKVEIEKKELKPKLDKKETKNDKKYTKKVSMFDVMPSHKTIIDPLNPKAQIERPNTIKDKEIKPDNTKPAQLNKTQIKPTNINNETKPNTNNMNNKANVQQLNKNTNSNTTNNKYNSIECDYGVIIPEFKKCRPTDRTQLGKLENIEIALSNPEKKESGFIKKAHITYMITTLPLKFKVRRRFSEISWFRQALCNLFPTNLIPAVSRKSKFGVDTLADAFVQKRLRAIQRFLNYLVTDPNIKDSQILLDFLYIGSENEFNNKKKVYENTKNITEVQDFKSKEEKVNLLVSGQKENYLENIKDNANININILKKLNNSFKLLFNEMKAVVLRMEEISSYWNQAYKASLRYFDSNATCETYKQLGNLFRTWSQIIKEQNTIVNIDIREHFKFMRKNFASMKDLGNSVEPMKSNYQKLLRNLMSKKDELYKKGEAFNNYNKAKSMQGMLPKETNIAINAKEMYGLYLNRALGEYERMRALNGKWNKTIVVDNVSKLKNLLSKFYNCVGEINSEMEASLANNSNDNKCIEKRIPLDESFLR